MFCTRTYGIRIHDLDKDTYPLNYYKIYLAPSYLHVIDQGK